ncbi:alpha/beta fold hydrolase [Leucobacter sp. CSA1]|uniref:Alpha/beta fold hydrolase n=1 Tax=Leucobacter chromiisoli TaxID=2796471 RepID=A0A934Q5X4_9MICO|nr:alpha/beta fold hydrolase [Leucobacter chromiisoli]MBK0417646.1 alpha/beta fold hydrolase [Leucobacter chromiisoli]
MTTLPDPIVASFIRDEDEIQLFRWPREGAERIVLVHGIGMGHAVYDRFVERISEEVDVTAVDLPGFGDAAEPKHAASIPHTADLLAAALRDQGLTPATAVGHSMGAQVVAELAARHPDAVDRAVLVAPTVNARERSVRRQALRMLEDIARGREPAVIAKGMTAYLRTGPRWFVKKLGPTLEHRIERTLPRVAQPTLVLRGVLDPVCPRDWAIRITSLLPRGEMLQLEGRGHEALISSGEPVARRVVDWMRSTPVDR